jgi:signal transduction histidine kinase
MSGKCLNRLLFVIFLSGLLPQNAFPVEKVRNVVVFFSLGSNVPAYGHILDGIKNILSKNYGASNNLIIEYLDIDRTDDEDYSRSIIDIYNIKFRTIKIDLLITVGPRLNPILIKYGLEALNTSPVIDIDIDGMPGRIPASGFPNQNRSEILIKFRMDESLKSCFSLFPGYKNVIIISGSSGFDNFFTSLIKKSETVFDKDHNFKYISGISIDSTIQLVKRIPEESIVIVPSFFADVNNTPFLTPEVISFISANCKAPVFPVTDSFIERNEGIGGYVFSYMNLGKEAGRVATEILNGKSANDIAVNETGFYQNIYNWPELKKWHLLHSKAIPKGSIIFNEKISFIARHKYYSLGVILFLISQTIIIIYLVRMNRRQKKISMEMHETEIMHHELIRTDRMAKMTELTASLSHELNQPLAAILYSAQAGKRFLQKDILDNSQANEIFDNIIEDDKRAGKIISSVRNIMKPEIKDHEKIELVGLIQETKDLIQAEAIRKSINIDFKSNPFPVYIMGDKIQLQQVLMNLIRNSFNAMEENGSEIKKIDISMNLNKEEVTVSVMDSGPGIDPGILEKLFKPFVTTRKDGSGIGLALSRSIMERHNGKIWGENIDGGGAAFSFRLKILKVENGKRHRLYHR